jgi:hypothetical protein
MKEGPISGVTLAALLSAVVIVLAASTASAGCIVHMSNGDKPCESGPLAGTTESSVVVPMWVHKWFECIEKHDETVCGSRERVYEWLHPDEAPKMPCPPGDQKPVCNDDPPEYEPVPQMQDPLPTMITTIPQMALPQSESETEYARTPRMFDAPNWLVRPYETKRRRHEQGDQTHRKVHIRKV